MVLMLLSLGLLGAVLVLSLFMSKNLGTPEVSAFEDQEQMLSLSGKTPQAVSGKERAT